MGKLFTEEETSVSVTTDGRTGWRTDRIAKLTRDINRGKYENIAFKNSNNNRCNLARRPIIGAATWWMAWSRGPSVRKVSWRFPVVRYANKINKVSKSQNYIHYYKVTNTISRWLSLGRGTNVITMMMFWIASTASKLVFLCYSPDGASDGGVHGMWRLPVHAVPQLPRQQEISTQQFHGRVQRPSMYIVRRQRPCSVPNLLRWSQRYRLLGWPLAAGAFYCSQ